MLKPLLFEQISVVSRARALIWHPEGLDSWSVSDWTVAMAGEAGEVADAVKKYNRIRDGIQQTNGGKTKEECVQDISTEVGDTYLYLDLLAQRIGQRAAWCVGQVQGGECVFMKNTTLQQRVLMLMNFVGELSLMAFHIDMPKDAGYSDHGRKIGAAIKVLDMIAESIGVPLEVCIVDTFNRVSERENFPQRLELDTAEA